MMVTTHPVSGVRPVCKMHTHSHTECVFGIRFEYLVGADIIVEQQSVSDIITVTGVRKTLLKMIRTVRSRCPFTESRTFMI